MLKISKSNRWIATYYPSGNYTIGYHSAEIIENVILHEEIHRVIHERIGLKESKQFDKICKKLRNEYFSEDYEGYLY